LLAVTLSYVRSSARLKELEEEKRNLYEKTLLEEDKILQKTQSDYQEIIHTAENRAKSIIEDAERLSTNSSSSLRSTVSDLTKHEDELVSKKSEEFVAEFQKQLQQVNTDNINMFKNVSKEVIDSISQQFEELKKLMQDQTINSKKLAEEKIKTEYGTLEKELQEYKKKEVEKIDQNIYQLLLNISKIAFGKGLNIGEHEKLIEEALQDAKREGAA
jgi:hypothetical protein